MWSSVSSHILLFLWNCGFTKDSTKQGRAACVECEGQSRSGAEGEGSSATQLRAAMGLASLAA